MDFTDYGVVPRLNSWHEYMLSTCFPHCVLIWKKNLLIAPKKEHINQYFPPHLEFSHKAY